ncbi:hypothetical protein SLEP1_g57612 [Rubroshorea leprosula]|uniref:Uncharacterized protein n=1 Tax=Rubroshorea leprosula TaxID=152421 RepID=A0AAV5MM27_9ROSI|nr:hypothetical protein SLEP1_g57612 [Rubroshorea leprosula]
MGNLGKGNSSNLPRERILSLDNLNDDIGGIRQLWWPRLERDRCRIKNLKRLQSPFHRGRGSNQLLHRPCTLQRLRFDFYDVVFGLFVPSDDNVVDPELNGAGLHPPEQRLQFELMLTGSFLRGSAFRQVRLGKSVIVVGFFFVLEVVRVVLFFFFFFFIIIGTEWLLLIGFGFRIRHEEEEEEEERAAEPGRGSESGGPIGNAMLAATILQFSSIFWSYWLSTYFPFPFF